MRWVFVFRLLYTYYICPFFIVFIKSWSTANPQDWWEDHCTWLCGINLQAHPSSVPIDRHVLIGANHRNLADYFVHNAVAKHTTNTLSRAGVGVAFPLAFIITYVLDTVWYFRRGNTRAHIDK
jgi:hypothetical protein